MFMCILAYWFWNTKTVLKQFHKSLAYQPLFVIIIIWLYDSGMGIHWGQVEWPNLWVAIGDWSTMRLKYCHSSLSIQPVTHWVSRQNGWHFADDIFKCIFLNDKFLFCFKFVSEGSIGNRSALVQVMAWHQTGDKLSLKPMMTIFYFPIWHH